MGQGKDARRAYQPPVLVRVGKFSEKTRGLTRIDLEIRVGKKAE